jgi:hypothetical protein
VPLLDRVETTPPVDDGALSIDEYDVTCTSPGQPDASNFGTSSPITVAGFTLGIQYSCTVVARNNTFNMVSVPSSPPATLTPATAPSVVTNIQCTAGPTTNQVTVTFDQPYNGGAPILFYRVYSADTADENPNAPSSPAVVTITSPISGHTYQFVVVAKNAIGFSSEVAPCSTGVTFP